MNAIYDASPECDERHCVVTRWYDVISLRYVYQHGDNPEAVLLIDRLSFHVDPDGDVRRKYRAFAERCHRYDDGIRSSSAPS